MTTRRGAQRPTPLQARYYRAGLNAGAVAVVDVAKKFGMDEQLARELDEFIVRLACGGAKTPPAPRLPAVHPMAAWASKKRRGR